MLSVLCLWECRVRVFEQTCCVCSVSVCACVSDEILAVCF